MDTIDLIEKGRKRVTELLNNIKRLEKSEAVADVLEEPDAMLCVSTKGYNGEDAVLKLDFIPTETMQKILNVLKKELRAAVAESKIQIESIVLPIPDVVVPEEPKPIVKVEEEKPIAKKMPFINKDFEEAIDKMVEEDKQKETEAAGKVAPVQLPGRFLSKQVISDAELKQLYFKDGLSVRTIAERAGIKPDSLYKRIQAMKEQQAEKAKECVRPQ